MKIDINDLEFLRNIDRREAIKTLGALGAAPLLLSQTSELNALQIKSKVKIVIIGGGAGGIKVMCAGRLGGAEIARTDGYKEGKVSLHTLKADIDYGFAEAFTTYGTIGVKVWIYKGDIIRKKKGKEDSDGIDAQKG